MRLRSPFLLLALATSALIVDSACAPVEEYSYSPTSKKKKAKDTGEEATAEESTDDETTGPDETTSPMADGGSTTATPQDNGTNGTGGAVGANTLTSTGGLKYMINAPAPGTKPRGLLVLLHGSSASNYTNMITMMSAVAQTYDLIRVSALAPNGQGWNEGNQSAGAEQLHQLVQQDLFPKYNIDKTRVMFSGQSSGGGFLSSVFIPAHAKDYRGGAFLLCGMAPPPSSFAPDAATKQAFKMHFEITTGDTIWPAQYTQAIAKYRSLGMQFTADNTKPGGHCAFDQQAVIQARIGEILGTR